MPAASAGSRAFSSHSRHAERIRRRYGAEMALLPAGVPTRAAMAQCVAQLTARGFEAGAALRICRQLVL